MRVKNLMEFIGLLESKEELVIIHEFVSPSLQISEITDRVSKNSGKALLFENTGTQFPLLINAFGSESRICTALGINSLEDPGNDIEELLHSLMQPRESLLSKLSALPLLKDIAAFMPKRLKKKGACQEIVMDNTDLNKLPILKCWPHDGGPFITLPVVHTKHPVTGQRNVGMYRMQVFGPQLTGMHWHMHKNSASHYQQYKKLGTKMPVAVILGGDPVYTYCATAPLPENMDEYLLAGFLRKQSVELVKCLTCDIEVPADADFVIEGLVDPAEDLLWEGPFGDHTGFYSLADYYPAFHVTCITHRKNAVYPTTIVGIPPQEDKWLGKATERIFLPLIRLSSLPEIIDMAMPDEGVFHNIVIAKIKTDYPGQAHKVMNTLWGAGQMMFNKILVVTDADIDIHNNIAVAQIICSQVDPFDDVSFNKGPLDILDHSGSKFAKGSKMGLDATIKNKGDYSASILYKLDSAKMPESIVCNTTLLEQKLPVLIVGIDKTKANVRDQAQKLFSSLSIEGVKCILFVDYEAVNLNVSDIIWLVANNIDPLRDCFYPKQEHAANHKHILCADGTSKTLEHDGFERLWPNVVTMDDKTINEVDKMWESLHIGPFLPSPSLRFIPIVKTNSAIAFDNC
jgi:4-hydroxy-3-polyprenylbenzoate decarboxylase